MTKANETQWRKSSYSAHEGGDCVEVAGLPKKIAVRDSKNPSSHIHEFTRSAFRALANGIKDDSR